MSSQAFDMTQHSVVGKGFDRSFLGNMFGVSFKVVRYYSYTDPVLIGEFMSLGEAKAALKEAVDNFNDTFAEMSHGDSMYMSEDGMSASSFMHGSIKIEEIGSDGPNI